MAAPVNPIDIMLRQMANKSDKKAPLEAIRMTLSVQSAAIRHNTQTFNRNRYTAISRIADYDEMKDRARQTNEKAIANLPQLLSQLEAGVRANGGHSCSPTARQTPISTSATSLFSTKSSWW